MAYSTTTGVPSHAQARELAEYGGNRIERLQKAMSDERERNAAGVTIDWRFRSQNACVKFNRVYPKTKL